MDKEKEIDEVYDIIDEVVSDCNNDRVFGVYNAAENVVNAGYRKADEVRKETIRECSAWLHRNAVVMEEEAFAREFDRNFGVEVDE